jgi:hypothetical protein
MSPQEPLEYSYPAFPSPGQEELAPHSVPAQGIP